MDPFDGLPSMHNSRSSDSLPREATHESQSTIATAPIPHSGASSPSSLKKSEHSDSKGSKSASRKSTSSFERKSLRSRNSETKSWHELPLPSSRKDVDVFEIPRTGRMFDSVSMQAFIPIDQTYSTFDSLPSNNHSLAFRDLHQDPFQTIRQVSDTSLTLSSTPPDLHPHFLSSSRINYPPLSPLHITFNSPHFFPPPNDEMTQSLVSSSVGSSADTFTITPSPRNFESFNPFPSFLDTETSVSLSPEDSPFVRSPPSFTTETTPPTKHSESKRDSHTIELLRNVENNANTLLFTQSGIDSLSKHIRLISRRIKTTHDKDSPPIELSSVHLQHPEPTSAKYNTLDMEMAEWVLGTNPSRRRKPWLQTTLITDKYPTDSTEQIELLVWAMLKGLKLNILPAVTDKNANYLFQKMVDMASLTQLYVITVVLQPHLSRLAIHHYGSRVLQRMIERSRHNPIVIDLIINGLSHGSILSFICNECSNHVMKKCLCYFTHTQSSFITECIQQHTIKVATDKFGCIVLQRALDTSSPSTCESILQNIIAHTRTLITHPFGNYVVQYVYTRKWAPDDPRELYKDSIVSVAAEQIVSLSCQKISSNVIETILHTGSELHRERIIRSILATKQAAKLCLDQYGNYVMQMALSVAPSGIAFTLLEELMPITNQLKFSAHGRKVHQKLLVLEAAYQKMGPNYSRPDDEIEDDHPLLPPPAPPLPRRNNSSLLIPPISPHLPTQRPYPTRHLGQSRSIHNNLTLTHTIPEELSPQIEFNPAPFPSPVLVTQSPMSGQKMSIEWPPRSAMNHSKSVVFPRLRSVGHSTLPPISANLQSSSTLPSTNWSEHDLSTVFGATNLTRSMTTDTPSYSLPRSLTINSSLSSISSYPSLSSASSFHHVPATDHTPVAASNHLNSPFFDDTLPEKLPDLFLYPFKSVTDNASTPLMIPAQDMASEWADADVLDIDADELDTHNWIKWSPPAARTAHRPAVSDTTQLSPPPSSPPVAFPETQSYYRQGPPTSNGGPPGQQWD